MGSPHSSVLIMDEEDSTASSFTGSPTMNTTDGGFDINYFLALTNPDISSSSSESQSQGSREATPSDWISMPAPPDHGDPNDPATWKFDTDALLSSGIDPNALILGAGQLSFDNSTYPPSLHPFQFEQAVPIREQVIHNQQQLHQGQFIIPEIIDSRSSYVVHDPQRPQQAEQQPFIHAPQPQHPIITPPTVQVTGSGAMVMDADTIGRRVRELAGIEYAVTASSHQHAPALPQLPQNLTGQQQLPVGYPALHSSTSPAPSSSAGSSGASPPGIPQYEGKASRAKTSHTTIERRYRTNLNARIVALRHAVPALRILEKDKFPNEKADERGYVDGVRAARKASKGSILGKATEYISVLKKREIRLRRDYEGLRALIYGLVGGPELLAHWDRAWREQHPGDDEEAASDEDGDDEDGTDDDDEKPRKKLKGVPAPLVSGGTLAVPTIPNAMGITGTQPDLKRKRGRPRKNPLPVVVPAPPPMHLAQQQQQPPPQAATYLMGVFLLFTFLNPATSPATSNSSTPSRSGSVLTKRAHKHVGAVLTALNGTLFSHPASQYVGSRPFSISWGEVIQYAHALVTILLFLSVARSIVPANWAPLFPRFLSIVPPNPEERKSTDSDEKVVMVDLATALEQDDRGSLAHALGCSHVGVFDALRGGTQALGVAVRSQLGFGNRTNDPIVRAAVVRLAELDLMHRESLSIFRRLYHISRLYVVLSVSLPSPSELTTLSLIAHSLPGAYSFAASSWSKARSVPSSRSRDKMILLDHSLDDAIALYEAGHTIIGAGRGGTGNRTVDGRINPLGLIASALVCERIRDEASELFTKESPAPTDAAGPAAYAGEPPAVTTSLRDIAGAEEKSGASLDEVVVLGRSLTKPVRELTHLFEDVAAGIQPASRGVSFMLDADNEDERDALGDARSFLQAILLYRRISSATQPASPTPSETSTLFAGSTFSPFNGLSESVSSRESSAGPGTPHDLNSDDERLSVASSVSAERLHMSFGKASAGSRLALRRILGSSTFASPVEINDARDRIVDFLVDTTWPQ